MPWDECQTALSVSKTCRSQQNRALLTDVAMKQPSSRIVRDESNSQPASCRQNVRISSSRIVEVERGNANVAEVAVATAQDPEVVAVEVHWVRQVDSDGRALDFLDDPVVPLRNDDKSAEALLYQACCE